MTDIESLIARVEAAEGADRELDALIRCAVFGPKNGYVERSKFNGAWCVYQANGKLWEPRGLTSEQRGGAFTTSLDAAMTLADDNDLTYLFDEAGEATGKRGWKTGGWRGAFIRNFVAACLRAKGTDHAE